MSGIYIHIPFCKQACSYCDFYFVTRSEQKEDFVRALVADIVSLEGHVCTEEVVKSVYFGGGTPSLLRADQFERILAQLDRTFTLEVDELTIEMNPDNVTRDYLRSLKTCGFDRLSMGVQSFSEKSLSFMNRAHNRAQALEALEDIVASSFNNYTVDLIYGQPNQTMPELQEDIEQLMEFKPPHISAYALAIEDNTRLAKQVELGRLKPAPDDDVADQMDMLATSLMGYGFNRYEVNSFAKEGFEAKHNQIYWSHLNYIGIGPGAHSFWWPKSMAEKERLLGEDPSPFQDIPLEQTTALRWSNPKDLKAYIQRYLTDEQSTSQQMYYQRKLQALVEPIGEVSLAEEYIWLGLRTSRGCDRSILDDVYNYEFTTKQEICLESLVKQGKVRQRDGRLQLTKEGMRLADYIALDLLS